MNARKAEYEERLDGVKQFMDYRKVNPDIQARVISWFGYVWRQGLSFDEEAITRSLPPRLHGQLAIHVHLETLKRVQLFQVIHYILTLFIYFPHMWFNQNIIERH